MLGLRIFLSPASTCTLTFNTEVAWLGVPQSEIKVKLDYHQMFESYVMDGEILDPEKFRSCVQEILWEKIQ